MADRSRTSISLVTYMLWALFGTIIIRTAWLSDDAFITLRTVDNFVHGYGLTWNIIERVQSYTHPLWMFLLSGVYFFSREGYYTTLGISILLSLISFGVVLFFIKQHNLATLAGVSMLLISKAFIDYSTSGLENPLSHLLLAIFLTLYLQMEDRPSDRKVFFLSLIAGLATLNRMDTFLLYAPALIFMLWKRRDRKAFIWVVIGFSPFIIWELFSLIYYGFPFPNTAYAKLTNGIGKKHLIEQGYLYFINSLNWDPITLSVIGLALGWLSLRGMMRERFVVFGLGLYLFYVLWIGGDFMSGRFFSVVLLGSVILLLPHLLQVHFPDSAIFLAVLVLFVFMSPMQSFSTSDSLLAFNNGIADERARYFPTTGLINDIRDSNVPSHKWANQGLSLRAVPQNVMVIDNAGMLAFYAGSKVYFIDRLALTDPLLARLKPLPRKKWRIGHFERAIPRGYVNSALGEDNAIKHQALAQYYDRLKIITRGNIWNWDRLATIVKFNLGQYDYLLDEYYESSSQP